METFITVIHVLTAIFMILVVLVQGGNAGGVGAAFGGGNSQGVFGAQGATSLLGKLTYGAAGVFMLTSIWLSVVQGNAGKTGLREKLENASGAIPATGASPAPSGQAEPAKDAASNAGNTSNTAADPKPVESAPPK